MKVNYYLKSKFCNIIIFSEFSLTVQEAGNIFDAYGNFKPNGSSANLFEDIDPFLKCIGTIFSALESPLQSKDIYSFS